MLRSAIPLRFQLAWGKNAAGAFIRTVPATSQIGIQDGAASFNDGFVPDNFTALAGGGVPPFGQDFNGVLNITTTWDQWYQAGAPISFDATYASQIGGYPQGAIVDSAIVLGAQWCSLVDGNTTDPDDPLTSANWFRIGVPVGTPMPFFTLPTGYVAMNALTIGAVGSNAGYANANALFLYAHNWFGFSNSQCPILTSAGAPTTRGANAVADFVALKQLTLPNGKGLGLIGVDTMGGTASTFLNGVPVTIGNTTTPGSILGETTHAMTAQENGPHDHNGITGGMSANDPHTHTSNANQSNNGASVAAGGNPNIVTTNPATINSTSVAHTHAIAASGSGTGHNTVHRSMGVFWGQKL